MIVSAIFKTKKSYLWSAAVLLLFLWGCNSREEPSGPGGWLKGGTGEKFNTVAGQLRGFDATMVEVGYRYQELYWAGRDGNWDYAQYQREKIGTTLKNGFERRPKRKASGEHFMDFVLPEMEKAIKARDSVLFQEKFEMMTVNCNACHTMEKVPYFTVKQPLERQSPIRFR